jgi:hypothetical protein
MDQQGFRENQPNELSEAPSWPITRTENIMYARQVSMELRPNSHADFTRRIESEILPLFAEVTKLLSKLVEGTPRVKSYEVANSTFHKIAATQKAA